MPSRRSITGSGRTCAAGRATGFVFLVPFLFFLWRGWIPKGLKARLWTIFAGGAGARRGRLVDGVVGPGRQQSRQRVAIPARRFI